MIHGVKENQDENIHETLIALFEQVGVENPQSLMLAAYHRLGKAKKGAVTPRPIIVRFVRRGDRDLVFQKFVSTRVDKVRVSQDLAERTLLRRNRLLPIYIDAKKKVGKEVKLVEDRLILRGKVYTLETLDTLPNWLSPFALSSKSNQETLVFFSALSPLSNFSPSVFHLNGTTFATCEHYYQYTKAVKLGDISAAAQILTEPDPAIAKRLGDKVEMHARANKTPAHQAWIQERDCVMLEGLLAKFSQNPHLATFLLDTGDTVLGEASPNDTYWGTGVPLKAEDACNQSTWKGSNRLGVIPRRVRHDIANIDTSSEY